jgi:hypothetical protein
LFLVFLHLDKLYFAYPENILPFINKYKHTFMTMVAGEYTQVRKFREYDFFLEEFGD